MFRLDITFADNEDFLHSFRWVDRKGSPIVLTGSQLRMHIRRTEKDVAPVLDLNTENGRIEIDTEEPHIFSMRIERGKLKEGVYLFDLLRTTPEGEQFRMAEGKIVVERGLTR